MLHNPSVRLRNATRAILLAAIVSCWCCCQCVWNCTCECYTLPPGRSPACTFRVGMISPSPPPSSSFARAAPALPRLLHLSSFRHCSCRHRSRPARWRHNSPLKPWSLTRPQTGRPLEPLEVVHAYPSFDKSCIAFHSSPSAFLAEFLAEFRHNRSTICVSTELYPLLPSPCSSVPAHRSRLLPPKFARKRRTSMVVRSRRAREPEANAGHTIEGYEQLYVVETFSTL
jgi:hypothetical protein